MQPLYKKALKLLNILLILEFNMSNEHFLLIFEFKLATMKNIAIYKSYQYYIHQQMQKGVDVS